MPFWVSMIYLRSGVHNLFAIAGGITFIFMNYRRQWFQEMFIFCVASLLLPPGLSGRLSVKYPRTTDKEFLSKHGRHNLYFKLRVHGRIHFYRKPHAAVRQQVLYPALE